MIVPAVVLFFLVGKISGHGMMLEPPNRSSVWRFDSSAPPNYDDNANFCGGVDVQWGEYNGKCGICGDPWDAAHPQDNENTGKYGQYGVVKTYTPGAVIDIHINLTANHYGFFNFSLCILSDPNAIESGEDCFQAVTLANGDPQYNVEDQSKQLQIYPQIKLPDGVTCDRCVLRWHYQAGNTWGQCDDGTWATGCGPQETFRSCADIAIL